jgi:flagellar biosynthesis protein FlhF
MSVEYFTEQATTHREAMARIQAKYGESATVLTQRNIKMGGVLGIFSKPGIEITGYISQEPVKKKLRDFEDEKRKILEMSRIDTTKTMGQILKEVQDLKDKLAESAVATATMEPSFEHPNIEKIADLLDQNEFNSKYSRHLLKRLRKELTVEELDDERIIFERLVDWMADDINIYPEREEMKPHVFILVGPTGVGKTTTIAKLAARQRVGSRPAKEVRIITIDNYRIGAKQQIETYGEIMGIPVESAESSDELKKYLALYNDVDIIFIDTIGKSPKDFETLGRMKGLLEGCGINAKTHLALSATTKSSDIQEIIQQFEPFNYESVVVTKLDETKKIGNIISSIWEKQKSISYMTDGQGVPHDIERANVVNLLLRLEGFYINRDRLEQRFLENEE